MTQKLGDLQSSLIHHKQIKALEKPAELTPRYLFNSYNLFLVLKSF